MFFVDASTDRVGINTASPAVDFYVEGQIEAQNPTFPVISATRTGTSLDVIWSTLECKAERSGSAGDLWVRCGASLPNDRR